MKVPVPRDNPNRRDHLPKPTPDERMVMVGLVKELIEHPALHDFTTKGGTTTDPWAALGERLMATVYLCLGLDPELGYAEDGKTRMYVPVDIVTAPESYDSGLKTAVSMATAPLFVWTEDMYALAGDTPLPDHVVAHDVLMLPHMFWTWENRRTGEVDGEVWETNWMYVFEANLAASGQSPVGGLVCMYDAVIGLDDSETMPRIELAVLPLAFGTRWPDGVDEYARGPMEQVLKFNAFLASEFVEKSVTPLPRARRRELKRTAASKAGAKVSVVRLRRKHHREAHEAGVSGRKYQGRWWVSGHFRNQWYPSLQAHKVKWIAPYVKGDSDAPLKERVYRVER